MRRTHLLVLSSLFLFGCGSSDNGSDGGSDGSSNPTDGSMNPTDGSGGNDGSANDSGGDSAMNNDGSMMNNDGGLEASVGCTKPADCMGNNVCCLDVALGAGQPPNCAVNSASTSCKSAQQCTTQIAFTCNAMERLRACAQNTDCTEQAYNKCCSFMLNMKSYSFCANNQLAQLAGGTCM